MCTFILVSSTVSWLFCPGMSDPGQSKCQLLFTSCVWSVISLKDPLVFLCLRHASDLQRLSHIVCISHVLSSFFDWRNDLTFLWLGDSHPSEDLTSFDCITFMISPFFEWYSHISFPHLFSHIYLIDSISHMNVCVKTSTCFKDGFDWFDDPQELNSQTIWWSDGDLFFLIKSYGTFVKKNGFNRTPKLVPWTCLPHPLDLVLFVILK